MAFESKDMSGALFKNDKGDNEKRPDYKGSIKIGGVEYRLSAWIKTSTGTGTKFMSLVAEPRDSALAAKVSSEAVPF